MVTLLVAVVVHLPALVLVGGGVAVVWSGGPQPWPLFLAAVLLAVAVVMRPRLGSRPRRWPVLTRSDAPQLFGVTDDISKRLGARGVTWMCFNLEYNCGTRIVGFRRRRLIVMGLPLWLVLSCPERVAVLAHEVAHDTNHDLAHGLVVGSALEVLASLRLLLRPPRRYSRASGSIFTALEAFSSWIAVLVMRGLSEITYGVFLLLLRYARRASPRAEYLADEQAARVAGVAATASSLDKMCLAGTSLRYLAAVARKEDSDIWTYLRSEIGSVPPKEHERQRRLAKRAGHRVDETHPPTALRIEVLRRLPASDPLVVVSDEQAEAINRELARVQTSLADAILERPVTS
jgi:hypothetical protein